MLDQFESIAVKDESFPGMICIANQTSLERPMRFLTGSKIQTRMKKIARRTDALMAAVAYWGTGAAERTGLTRSKKPENVRVICDLLSGACNP